MSSHYVFEVHVKTPGEDDREQETVESFAGLVQNMAALSGFRAMGVEVTVGDVERT